MDDWRRDLAADFPMLRAQEYIEKHVQDAMSRGAAQMFPVVQQYVKDKGLDLLNMGYMELAELLVYELNGGESMADAGRMDYFEVEEWTKKHGGELGRTSAGGERDHVWGIRSAAMSLCGLWPGPDRTKRKIGQLCDHCHASVETIRDKYTRLEGGPHTWV